MRDLKKVVNKLLEVLHPKGDRNVLRDCKYLVRKCCVVLILKFFFSGDLWGPLLLCLTLAM
jgi:hypothetical protein